MSESWYRWQDDDLILSLRVQPRASRDEIAGRHGNHLKVRLTAPPVDGKANRHLLRFLARTFGVPNAQVELLSGQSGRTKKVRILGPRRLPEVIPPRPGAVGGS